MDSGVVNRVRLWLRSERQWGLRSVVLPASDRQAEAHETAEPAPEPPPRAVTPVARVPAPAAERPRPEGGNENFAPFAIGKQTDIVRTRAVAPHDATTTQLIPPTPAAPAFDAPPLTTEQKRARLVAMNDNEVRGCTKCRLCEARTNTVFGEGAVDARIFIIGEGPGETEDRTGRPFVGRAGELLNKWIVAMGLAREEVYIANIVKCRPPANRAPAPDEVATCTPYLQRQLEIVRPEVILTLGLPASQYMLQSKVAMGRLRGNWHDWRGIKLMPTYHPSYVLRQYTVETRRAVWNDLKQVMAELGLPEQTRE